MKTNWRYLKKAKHQCECVENEKKIIIHDPFLNTKTLELYFLQKKR